MPTAISGGGRIRTNIPAMNAYNALLTSGNKIANSQLRLSTGKRINSAADDVSGYITSRNLSARNSALKAALNSVGDAKNVTAITNDALDNIGNLLIQIKESASIASSGAMGTDEKVALAKSAFRLSEQIQFITDSTVFGGEQLLQGSYSGDWTIGYYANEDLLEIDIDLTTNNADYNVESQNFNLNATSAALASAGGNTDIFAGVTGLNLQALDSVAADDLGIFGETQVKTTITSLAAAIDNVSNVAAYLGGIQVRLDSQNDLLNSQITNYSAAISRIEDADVAQEQLSLVKNQFLQQASTISLAQANQTPSQFLQLFG
ncbi:flagellin [Candidatus Kapabacteria bacterium]|nr:flagellin [Candidatus Kapabacteria bacterium]